MKYILSLLLFGMIYSAKAQIVKSSPDSALYQNTMIDSKQIIMPGQAPILRSDKRYDSLIKVWGLNNISGFSTHIPKGYYQYEYEPHSDSPMDFEFHMPALHRYCPRHSDSLFIYVAYDYDNERQNGRGTMGMGLSKKDFNVNYLKMRVQKTDPSTVGSHVAILSVIKFPSWLAVLKFMSK